MNGQFSLFLKGKSWSPCRQGASGAGSEAWGWLWWTGLCRLTVLNARVASNGQCSLPLCGHFSLVGTVSVLLCLVTSYLPKLEN